MSHNASEPRYSLHTDTLPNGLHLLHYHTQARVAYAALLVGVGSRDEMPHEHGISHMVEHMLFKGTHRRTAFQIATRLEEVGGELNAYTSKEETVVHAAFLPRYLARSLELMADVICNTAFPERELAREKEVILEEIASYADSPAELIYDEFEELAFEGHPLAHSILGTRQSVRRITRADLLAYIQRLYVAPRMVVATCGPFPFDQVLQHVHRLFGDVPVGDALHVRIPFAAAPAHSKSVRRRTAQRHCMVGARTLPIGDERVVPLALLSNLLGGYATTSRLNRALRERAGLAYSVECATSAYSDTGIFTIYFGTDPQHAQRAFAILWRELDRVRTEPLTPNALRRAKQQYIGQLHLAAENMESTLLANARRLMEGLPLIEMSTATREIEAVTSEEILWVAQHLLADENLLTLTYR